MDGLCWSWSPLFTLSFDIIILFVSNVRHFAINCCIRFFEADIKMTSLNAMKADRIIWNAKTNDLPKWRGWSEQITGKTWLPHKMEAARHGKPGSMELGLSPRHGCERGRSTRSSSSGCTRKPPWQAVRRALKFYGFKPYLPQIVQKLKAEDQTVRIAFA